MGPDAFNTRETVVDFRMIDGKVVGIINTKVRSTGGTPAEMPTSD